MGDRLSVLLACGKRMTKLVTPSKVEGYEGGYKFKHHEIEVNDIHDLHHLLTEIEPIPQAVIIRGQLVEGIDANLPVLRRKDDHNDGKGVFYRMNPDGLHSMMADFDKLPNPPDLHPDDRLEYLVGKLPEPFRDVSYHFQWSSSSGLPDHKTGEPPWSKLSCHLWYFMEKKLRDDEIGRWAEEQDIDESVMRTVQPNYVAAPLFINGAIDPFLNGGRSGFVQKTRDSVPAFAIPTKPLFISHKTSAERATVMKTIPPAAIVSANGRVSMSLSQRLAAIDTRLHMPIQRAIAAFVATVDDDEAWEDFKERICARINASPHGEKHIYLDDRYLEASYEGAKRKFNRSPQDRALSKLRWNINRL